jgi:four helix bundle protein
MSGIDSASWYMSYRDLDVLEAANLATDLINEMLDRPRERRLLYVSQMRESVQSIGANIAEGFGRGYVPDRARSLRIAKGEADETIRHVSANFRTRRIAPKEYWRIHNLLVVIAKMLTSFLRQ